MLMRCILLAALLTPLSAPAQFESPLRDAGSLGAIRLAGSEDQDASKVYIVQLTMPSAAEYHAARAAAATMPGTLPQVRARFDKSAADIQRYTTQLQQAQDRVIQRAGTGAELIYRYRFGLNGFAARMHPSQAHKLESMAEVLHVWEDEIRPLATNFSLDFLNLFDQDKGLRGPAGLDGEDIVIGVIDSGIAPEHPALRDTREADRPRLCQSDWAENSLLGRWLCRRFRKREATMVYEPPVDWNGACDLGERFEATDCNNKLIGARWFVSGAEASGPLDDGEIRSARDADGHGTHTATTAAGNKVRASIFGSFIDRVQGVAPRARIAVYKACWLRPGDLRASCNTSDLANAIDAAVADGVDIINYSIGSSLMSLTAPDDLALMAAAKAGVVTVAAAGNEGPNLGTIGSPAGGPWVIAAAASSRAGRSSIEAMEITSPASIAGKYVVKEANFTPQLLDVGPLDGDLVLADDNDQTLDDGGAGTTSDACQPLVNDTDVFGNIAFIQRGGCSFDIKVANAEDAGAAAVLVYNIAGDPIVMNGTPDSANIPAQMIGQADGNLILAEFDAGNTVAALFDKSLFITESESGNRMAVFSARGPGPASDILKPDVTAPGVNILAGFTPDAANATPGENFAYLSGTSMSTPHVAGVAALLRQAHPQWSAAAIKSALMTTARQDVTADDGETQALPFDFGAGHIVPNDAARPGLIFDVSNDEYDAFACGTASPAVSTERCDALAAAGYSFASADLNQPAIAIGRLANQRTVTRRVTNVGEEATTYAVNVEPPAGIGVAVDPPVLTLQPGEAASYDVTLSMQSGPLDAWRFGSLTWETNEHSVYSVLAVRPISVTAPAELTDFGASGTLTFPVEFGFTGAYTPGVHGLRLPLVINGFVDDDPTKTFTFRTTNGVTAHLIDVPADQAYLRFALFDTLTDGDEDLDLYIYYCADNVDCVRVGESGEPSSNEEVNFLYPAAGRYAALVHGFETDNVSGGPGANYELLGWTFGLVDDQGNMTAAGPTFVNAGTTEDVTVSWSGLQSNTIYLGGIGHNTPQGLSAITVIRIGN
jgi:subtilisin family serine protease